MTRPDRPFHGRIPNALLAALLMAVAALGALLAAFLPLAMPLGLAAGGIVETGQMEPGRWWAGSAIAVLVLLLLSWRWDWRIRLYWLALFLLALGTAILLLVTGATAPVSRAGAGAEAGAPSSASKPLAVGVITALPLFWPEGAEARDLLMREGPGKAPSPPPVPVMHHRAVPIDHVDEAALGQVDAVLLAQPRLLQPMELVRLDAWVRAGGRMLVLADPLLVWPGSLPPADPRRAPLTSLLDPLLTHWGLRLEPADPARHGMERRLLASGHALMLAGASRFSVLAEADGRMDGVDCALAERGLMALCSVGRGEVRLVADADLIDDRLWLADRRWPARPEAWSADVPSLLDAWLEAPLSTPAQAAPRRVKDEAALYAALRHAMLALLIWAGLGMLGQGRISGRRKGEMERGEEDKAGTAAGLSRQGKRKSP